MAHVETVRVGQIVDTVDITAFGHDIDINAGATRPAFTNTNQPEVDGWD